MKNRQSSNQQVKLENLEQEVAVCLKDDQKQFKSPIFENGKNSTIQKHFHSVQQTSSMPSVMYLNNIIAVTDKEAAGLFNLFFQSVFTTSHYKRNPKEFITKIDKIQF